LYKLRKENMKRKVEGLLKTPSELEMINMINGIENWEDLVQINLEESTIDLDQNDDSATNDNSSMIAVDDVINFNNSIDDTTNFALLRLLPNWK
jgi:hypothetical protein